MSIVAHVATRHRCDCCSTEAKADVFCCLGRKGTWATADTDAAAARAVAALAAAMPRIPTPAWQQLLVAGPDSDISAAEGEGPSSRSADSEVGPHSDRVELARTSNARRIGISKAAAVRVGQPWHGFLSKISGTSATCCWLRCIGPPHPTSHYLYASHVPQLQQLLVRLLPAVLALLRPTLQRSSAGSGDFLSPSGAEAWMCTYLPLSEAWLSSAHQLSSAQLNSSARAA